VEEVFILAARVEERKNPNQTGLTGFTGFQRDAQDIAGNTIWSWQALSAVFVAGLPTCGRKLVRPISRSPLHPMLSRYDFRFSEILSVHRDLCLPLTVPVPLKTRPRTDRRQGEN
jgi:hypothetical protein